MSRKKKTKKSQKLSFQKVKRIPVIGKKFDKKNNINPIVSSSPLFRAYLMYVLTKVFNEEHR